MRRRELIVGLAGAATWSLSGRAQQHGKPVIGYLHAGTAETTRHLTEAFGQGLSQFGYVDGQNVTIEYRWAEYQYDRLPALAAELVRRPVTMIAVGTPIATLAAKQATGSIPIVFHIGSDPVRDGLVASLNRPGANITGATFFSNLLTAKRLGLLHELVPKAKLIAAMVNPKNANAQMQTSEADQAARARGLELVLINAATESDIDKSFDNLKKQKVEALIILSDAFLNSSAADIAYLALRHALPTCFAYREPAVAGGLMSYGASRTDAPLQAGKYAGRILKGEKPADLPVQQPAKFEFVINMKTAKALGLAVPYSMQVLADELIE